MAYYIGGHGGDMEFNRAGKLDTFTVPPGCTIVVKAHPGEQIFSHRTPHESNLNTICKTRIDVLKNPIEHRAELYATFKSVAIYPAGSMCPNFSYVFNCVKGFTQCTILGAAGVIDLERFITSENCKKKVDFWVDSAELLNRHLNIQRSKGLNPTLFNELVEYIASMYTYSVYPTREFIRDYLNAAKELIDKPSSTTLELLERVYSVLYHEGQIGLSQKDLCELYPGVYYNFVCRGCSMRESVNYTSIGTIPTARHETMQLGLQRLVRDRIGEAEFHRKPGVRNASLREGTTGGTRITRRRTSGSRSRDVRRRSRSIPQLRKKLGRKKRSLRVNLAQRDFNILIRKTG